MGCVGVKARALSQCTINVMSKQDDGSYVDAVRDESVGSRDKSNRQLSQWCK